MTKEPTNIEYSPYIPSSRKDKEEKMSMIRTALIICITILFCVGLLVYYGLHDHRYKLIQADRGLYIFDNQTSVTNYCNTHTCVGLSSGMIVPHKYYEGMIPGVPLKSHYPSAGGIQAYLPQGNQAYVLQPIPQKGTISPQKLTVPAPQPVQAPPVPIMQSVAPVPQPAATPEISVPAVLAQQPRALFDEDMGEPIPGTPTAMAAAAPAMPSAPMPESVPTPESTPPASAEVEQPTAPATEPGNDVTGGFEPAESAPTEEVPAPQ
jgi:hypothetical protein